VVLFLQNTTSKEIIQGAKYQLTEFIGIPNPPSNVLAVDNGTSVNLSWNSPSGSIPQNYAVYRLLSGQEADESVWTLLSGGVEGTSYEDIDWGMLPNGNYKWAVKARYGTELSTAEFSNQMIKEVLEFPTLSVFPDSLSQVLSVMDTQALQLSLINSGAGILNWSSQVSEVRGSSSNLVPASLVLQNRNHIRDAVLAAYPSEGVINPGSNQIVDITMSAGNTAPGNYHYNIAINSNDPVNPELVVPISLEVTETHNVPESLTANAGDSVVFLSWNAVESPSLQHYQIYRDGLPLGTTTYNYYEDSSVVMPPAIPITSLLFTCMACLHSPILPRLYPNLLWIQVWLVISP
jgi:hypothetical protein